MRTGLLAASLVIIAISGLVAGLFAGSNFQMTNHVTKTVSTTSYVTSTLISRDTVTSTLTTVSLKDILQSGGPIAIFPLSYLPPPCPPSSATSADYYNSTYLVTRVNNYTLSGILSWHTNLTHVYYQIIKSNNFQTANQGRFWVVAYWNYYYYNGRPVVESLFLLPNSNGTIYGYLTPLYYYLDNSQVSVTFTRHLATSCPAS